MITNSRLPITPQLADQRVVAILRAPTADRFLDIATTLADAGIRCLEFTLTSRGCLEALRVFTARADGEIAVGAGTVLTVEQADAAADAGAGFIVAPDADPAVIARAAARGLACYPGAATPTEIVRAWRAGATAVKLFPAQNLGGPGYLRRLREPLPDIPLVPTGGVDIADVAGYLEAGAAAVGVGGPLLQDAASGGDLGALAVRARRLLAAARVYRAAE
jgi:2-dehydro-3-deoxyphosphogluconate aldolase / (4S)-4-hydroxy-2-oxoglutarate aldolase